jgi:feruloyl esterase
MMLLALAAAGAAAAYPQDFVRNCGALNAYAFSNGAVTEARDVPEGPGPAMPQGPNGGNDAPRPVEPHHCLIRGDIDARTGADGQQYKIGFELRLPAEWNGRFLFQGGGGLNGVIVPAIGGNISNGSSAPDALARHFAVVSTDSGHQGKNFDDTSFARDQEAKLNYGYASIGKVTSVAKQLIGKVTGRQPDHSYFMGCSNGGREAMIAAQRFPLDFDGVLAGNPAFNLSAAAVLTNYSGWAYEDAAKKLGTDSTKLFNQSDTALLHSALLRECDGLDGAMDGMIFDHAACRFDVKQLACRKGQTANCLDPIKVEAIDRAFRGPVDAQGKPIAGSWTFDTANFTPDWMLWQTGLPTPNGPMRVLQTLVRSSLTNYFAYPQYAATLAGGDAEAARLLDAAKGTAAYTNATSTEYSSFAGHKGKLMIVSGWSDPVFSATDLTAYYDRLSADTEQAGGKDVQSFARLFLIPGMAHCGGGQSLDDFDALSVLVDWVEKDKAPASFNASGRAFPGVERPICAYPLVARHDGQGPANAAGSYTCAPAEKTKSKG